MLKIHFFALCAGFLLASRPVLADEKKPDPLDAEVAKLVRYLGSPEFNDREKAEARLMELGLKALTGLRAGFNHHDLEVASRCEKIATRIRAAEREAIISGKKDMPGEAGKRFKELVGDSKASRTLFVYMTDDDRRGASVERAASDPAKADQVYREETGLVEQAWKKRFLEFNGVRLTRKTRQASQETVTPGDVVEVLFLGSYPLPAGAKDESQVESVFKASFMDIATLEAYKEPVRKLFVKWLENRREANAIRTGLNAALRAYIPEAVPTARRIVLDPKSDASLVGVALLVLGNLGSLNELAALATLREDKRTYDSFESGKVTDTKVQLQVRDQATGMSLLLRKIQLFPGVTVDSVHGEWWTFGGQAYKSVKHFESDKEREIGLAKAWNWLERQPKVEPK